MTKKWTEAELKRDAKQRELALQAKKKAAAVYAKKKAAAVKAKQKEAAEKRVAKDKELALMKRRSDHVIDFDAEKLKLLRKQSPAQKKWDAILGEREELKGILNMEQKKLFAKNSNQQLAIYDHVQQLLRKYRL
jgi:hypothetical protein